MTMMAKTDSGARIDTGSSSNEKTNEPKAGGKQAAFDEEAQNVMNAGDAFNESQIEEENLDNISAAASFADQAENETAKTTNTTASPTPSPTQEQPTPKQEEPRAQDTKENEFASIDMMNQIFMLMRQLLEQQQLNANNSNAAPTAESSQKAASNSIENTVNNPSAASTSNEAKDAPDFNQEAQDMMNAGDAFNESHADAETFNESKAATSPNPAENTAAANEAAPEPKAPLTSLSSNTTTPTSQLDSSTAEKFDKDANQMNETSMAAKALPPSQEAAKTASVSM